jgi:guanylate kinase
VASSTALDPATDTMRTLMADQDIVQCCAEGDAAIGQLLTGRSPRLFIISGPSGVGKDSVLEKLQQVHPTARYVVTATSRGMRPGERDGVHYRFLERGDFERKIANGEFIEHALVYGNLYGVPRTPIEDGLANGQDVIVKVDVQGAATLRQRIDNTRSIFLMPESMESLLQRLVDRKTEDPEVVKRRFRTANDELRQVEMFDYVVFNEAGKLDDALTRIIGIVEAERATVHQPQVKVR